MDAELVRISLIVFAFGFAFGILKSAFGLAAVLLTPVLAFLVPVKTAVAIVGPMALIGDALTTRASWGRWDGASLRRMIPAAGLATFVGAFVLAGVPVGLMNKVVAICIWLYVAAQYLLTPPRQGAGPLGWLGSPTASVFLAFGSGLLGSLSHAGGVLLAPHLFARGLVGERFVTTMVAILLAQGVVKVPSYLLTGVLTRSTLLISLAAAPFIYAGILVGRVLAAHISAGAFRLVLHGVMAGTGILLFVR